MLQHLEDLERLLDEAGVLIVALSVEGRVVFINEYACRLLEGKREEILGKSWMDSFIPSELHGSMHDVHASVLSGDEESVRFENPVVTLKGRERLILWNNTPISNTEGTATGSLSVGLDITELAATRESAERQAALLRGVLKTAVDAVITIDDQGRIESFNQAAERIFGYAAEEIRGEPVSRLMPEPYASAHDDFIESYLRTGDAKIIGIGRELVALHKDGTEFPCELSVSEVKLGDRRIFTGLVRDITKRKEVEWALRQSEELYRSLQLRHTELERAAVAGEMASIVAHEVRTPLNALAINAQMIKRMMGRNKPDDRQKMLKLLVTIEREVERINSLLETQLRSVRAPRQRDPSHAYSVSTVVSEALVFIEFLAHKHRVKVHHDLSEDVPDLNGDDARVRQLLSNLLLNALQAMPDGGDLYVATRRDADSVHITIRDTGPGVEPDILDRLFQPFVTTKEQGTGLGLAICDRLVKEMGGSIGVQSNPGKGATFEVRLPVVSPGG